MTEVTQKEGLRSRKKKQTHDAIEYAALELFAENGYDEVTIDDICERADVSRKTFFNYFPSKLSVATGYIESPPDPDQLHVLLEEHKKGNYIDVLVNIIEKDPPVEFNQQIWFLRKQALTRMPHIVFQEHRQTADSVNALISALSEYLEAHPEARIHKEVPVRDEVFEALSIVWCILQIRTAHGDDNAWIQKDSCGENDLTGDDCDRDNAAQPSVTETRHALAHRLLSDEESA